MILNHFISDFESRSESDTDAEGPTDAEPDRDSELQENDIRNLNAEQSKRNYLFLYQIFQVL